MEFGLQNGLSDARGQPDWHDLVFRSPNQQRRRPERPSQLTSGRQKGPAKAPIPYLSPVPVRPIGPLGRLEEVTQLPIRHPGNRQALPQQRADNGELEHARRAARRTCRRIDQGQRAGPVRVTAGKPSQDRATKRTGNQVDPIVPAERVEQLNQRRSVGCPRPPAPNATSTDSANHRFNCAGSVRAAKTCSGAAGTSQRNSWVHIRRSGGPWFRHSA